MIAEDHANGLRSEAHIFYDIVGSPTYLEDAAAVLVDNLGRDRGRIVHMSPDLVCSWAELLEDFYPKVTSVSYKSSVSFRDVHRNAGLVPTSGWQIRAGGLQRFRKALHA